tara:strand:+ start:856 stop:1191 length:336 start_codon:yes stop_codon:yes gene_type:complete
MWFDILKRRGRGGKPAIQKWIKNFIREHLESMSSGEKITTNDMIELLNENIRDATYLDQYRNTQVRFSSNTKFDKFLTAVNIGAILMRQNTDIVDAPKTPKGRSKKYVVRK